MVITKRRIFIVVSVLGIGFLVVVGIFIFMLAYSSKTDVSDQDAYAQFLNIPLEVKHTATLSFSENQHRFSNYSISTSDGSDFEFEDVKSIKHYKYGDTLTFYKAMKFYSMHVGDTYYLIGRDTLDNGKAIEFEYYLQDKYFYNIWETEKEFLDRVKAKN